MEAPRSFLLHRFDTFLGPLLLGATEEKLCLCYWEKARYRERVEQRIRKSLHVEVRYETSPLLSETMTQLNAYFKGERLSFHLPLLYIGTDFQKKVWQTLLEIPRGETLSYGQLAERIGAPKSYRAVATAVAQNPLQVILPCHRVIAADGRLNSYAGGTKVKQFLLQMERENKIFGRMGEEYFK